MRQPAIVFTEYRDTLERLRDVLTAAGHDVAVLHGGMTPAERSVVQDAFNGVRLKPDTTVTGPAKAGHHRQAGHHRYQAGHHR